MPSDFRYRADSRQRKSTPGWKGFGAGFVAGTLSLGLIWLTVGSQKCPDSAASLQQDASPQAAESGKEPANAAHRLVFTYPQVLAQQEVVVPEAEATRPPALAPPPSPGAKQERRPVPSESRDGALVLQVAALRNSAEAGALRAKLATRGLLAHVQEVKINNEAFFRVRLGPYSSHEQLAEPRERLKAAGFASLTLRQK